MNNNSSTNNQILVQFLNETPAEVREEMRARFNATLEDTDTIGGVELWSFDSDAQVTEALESLENNSKIGYVERNSVITSQSIPNDPKFNLQWGLYNTYNGKDIDAVEAWDITKGSTDVVIAVIDTGVDYNHPDLRNNIWVNPGEVANNGIDDDNNGYVDDYNGYDFLSEDANPMDGTSGHGTHVAGIIGAQANNSIGVSGVAPNVKIMPIRAVGGSTFDVLQAINYVNMMESRGVNIVATNNSYAFTSYNQGIRDAIAQSQQQGILYVASAGNSGANNDTSAATGINSNYPAVYNLDNIISVASTDSNDLKASSSNYGATTVDLGAPGVNIYSTTPNNTYGYKGGTSMAAPQVTGVVALLASQNPTWSYQQIRERIFNTVDPVASLAGITATGGRLNAYRALTGAGTPVSPLNLSINDVSVNESVGNALVTVSLSRATSEPITVDYATQNSSATAGNDYTSTNGTLTIPANQTSASISIPVIDDTISEVNETFSVNLSNAIGATITDNQSTVTITDNDIITPAVTVGSVSITEGNSSYSWATFSVTLDRASNQSVSVVVASANGTGTASSDYTSFTRTFNFNAGTTRLTQRVKIFGDVTPEADETVRLVARNPVNATLATGEGTITILNDDGLLTRTAQTISTSSLEIANYLGSSSNSYESQKADLFSVNSNLVETIAAQTEVNF